MKNKKIKIKLKKGDLVRVISGDERGKEGKILFIDTKKYRAIVEGVNLVTKSEKPNAKNTKGGLVKKEAPIHISNLMYVENGKTTRIGRKLNESGKLVRYSKKTNQILD
jgi:large subunit ribosomal protein L24